ncbi:MAG: nitrous oxide reductase accessory protein NosL [Desulfuromonadales bacterium]|nr:nitrous oxide reductase accessory protein NosL [Desulfuromonadales bacterium]MBN2791188.1 nitrous oxide reductase accessory protein NosL [Desulfuromonadales bacterium]
MKFLFLFLGKACVVLVLFLIPLQVGAFEPQLPGKRDRCPVCGMFVAPYPDWIATLVLKDGQQIYFDGCKDLFRYYFRLKAEQVEEIETIYVTEYYRAELVPVTEVLFVLGSDVYGPMGKELIPVSGEDLARTFMADHGGSGFFSFDAITPELLPVD